MTIVRGSLIVVSLLIAIAVWAPARLAAGEKKPMLQLQSALIVTGGLNPAKAYRVHDAKKLAELERFFPNYRQRPKSDRACGCEMGYEVFFMFNDRSILRVTVSASDDEPNWSMGDGDLELKGDLRRFIAELDGAKAQVEIDKSRPTLP